MPLEIPTRRVNRFIEHRGEYRDIDEVDRPYRVETDVFNEDKGCREDRRVYLTDYEILEAGGIQTFFNDDGSRKKGAWPYDPSKKAVAKKKAKKKAAKKK